MWYNNTLWFLIAATAAALPIPFIKQYTLQGGWWWIALSVLSYLTLILAYYIILRDKNITVVYPFLKVLSVLLVVLAGVSVFHDRLTMTSVIGIGLGIVSLYLLSAHI